MDKRRKLIADLKTMGRYLWPYRKHYLLGFIALLVVDGLNVLPPLILRSFVDHAESSLQGRGGSYNPFFLLGLMYLGVAIVQGFCRYIWRIWLMRASHLAVRDLRNELFQKLQRLSTPFYSRLNVGDLMARATSDIEAYRFAIGPGLLVFADAIFLFITIPVAMFILSPKLAAITLVPLIVMPFFILYIQKVIQRQFFNVQGQFSKLASFAQESVYGISVVKTFTREQEQLSRFFVLGREFVRRNMKLAKAQGLMEPVFLVTVGVAAFLLLGFAGMDVINGTQSIGTFVAFTKYLESLVWPLMALGMSLNHFQRGKVSLNRILLILSEEDHPALVTPKRRELNPASVPLLEFRSLSFHYPTAGFSLRNISFSINPGQKTAIVGSIGSGKSTLVKLIGGELIPNPQSIFLGGVDLVELNQEQINSIVGVVPQKTFLFQNTVGWNLEIAKTSSDPSLFDNAIQRAALQKELREWTKDRKVSENGGNLSGGQRTRLSLARTLYQNPKLLVLDDIFSSLDSENEKQILSNLSSNKGSNQAILLCTHRIANTLEFDQVIVLQDGFVVEQGAPKELIEKNGFYQALFQAQVLEFA